MEDDQDNVGERRNNQPPEDIWERIRRSKACRVVVIVIIVFILVLIACCIAGVLSASYVWYFCAFVIGLIVTFAATIFLEHYCRKVYIRSDRRVTPGGLRPRAAQGGQPARAQRRPEIGERLNTNAAGASLIDAARGASSLQNPVVLFRSGQFCHILQPGQQRTQAESGTHSQEGSSLMRPVSGESSAASKVSVVAPGVSNIASKRTAGRERIRTRSMTKKQFEEASTSSAGQEVDPSVPGPSHLHSPERPVRHLRSKKTESHSQLSDRQSVPRSSLSGRSTAASGGVRRRENFAARKGSVEKKPDYGDSESFEHSESEQD